jgi:hypothetical protein
MPASPRSVLLESCMICDRLAPDRIPLIRSADRFGNERAPEQRRMAPICARCLLVLQRAGPRGLVETESGARWTLATIPGVTTGAPVVAPPPA